MPWELSEFGQGLCTGSGIGELMEDLGAALTVGGERIRMLGGGQPAHIPEIDAVWRQRMNHFIANGLIDFSQYLGIKSCTQCRYE